MTEKNKSIKKFPNSGNIPKLRFSEFTEEWGTKTLGKIGQVINGLTYSPNDIDEHGVLVLRSSNVQNRTITFTDNVFVKANNFNPVKENDILICVRNGSKNLIGKNALVKKQNEGLAFGAFMAIYRSEFNRFLFQWFDTKDYKDIVNKNLGATINSINGGDLKKFKVPFPSLKEQEKIASFLSLIDERILSQKKIIEDLQITKKEISLKLFKDGFNSPKSKKENFQKLGDITYVVNKKNKENLKLPVYSINNKKGFISQSEQFDGIDSDERGYDISLYKIIEKETFAYNPARINVGSIGYSGNLENIIISSLYVCFKTTDTVDDGFLFQYLRTDIFRKEVLRNVEGGVRDYLFYESFSRIKINLPDIKEQKKIAEFLYKLDEKINLENDLLIQYENQKKYLLQNLFI
ncbi:hypothetical protein CMU96_10255 [Elizabethkingia anophelis]|nr:hypothetical protein [Elizabethkingia anophelis]MDV2465815.1 hypothetical protein [Elizabethkingia anophelis]MDV3824154.1 hypothetical protein [Elizabethkingia anophelis]MDV3851725.1 hypothetical protein [Elizabethkingia anophelis]